MEDRLAEIIKNYEDPAGVIIGTLVGELRTRANHDREAARNASYDHALHNLQGRAAALREFADWLES